MISSRKIPEYLMTLGLSMAVHFWEINTPYYYYSFLWMAIFLIFLNGSWFLYGILLDFLLLLSLLSLCFVTLDKAHHTLGHRISRISFVPLEKLRMRMLIATEEGKSHFHTSHTDIIESWILNLPMMWPMQSVNLMELN